MLVQVCRQRFTVYAQLTYDATDKTQSGFDDRIPGYEGLFSTKYQVYPAMVCVL